INKASPASGARSPPSRFNIVDIFSRSGDPVLPVKTFRFTRREREKFTKSWQRGHATRGFLLATRQ
ncbi:MAG: hypothetical protein LBD64_04730, partial [Odoribacteraceae bacterium]|nr:hypothetical protein [Odoribacteraceae bacterium]